MKKAAIIGMGDIYPIHLAAIQANPNIELAGVCDIDASLEQKAPENVPFYTDYNEMLEKEQPDVVHICLPHYLHVPVSIECAKKGYHVFCEKPVGLSEEQANALLETEENHPEVQIGICLQNRRNESVEALKKIIDSKEFGELKGIRGSVNWCRPKGYYDIKPWRGQMEFAGGGCMINQSVHTLDLLNFLAGPIQSLKAVSTQLNDYGIEVEDTVCAKLVMANGAPGLFFATNANYANESVQISVLLEKAEFEIDRSILYRIHEDGSREKIEEDQKMPGSKFYYGASHGKIINEFYRAIEENTQDYLHVNDAMNSIRLIDAILKSSASNEVVTL